MNHTYAWNVHVYEDVGRIKTWHIGELDVCLVRREFGLPEDEPMVDGEYEVGPKQKSFIQNFIAEEIDLNTYHYFIQSSAG